MFFEELVLVKFSDTRGAASITKNTTEVGRERSDQSTERGDHTLQREARCRWLRFWLVARPASATCRDVPPSGVWSLETLARRLGINIHTTGNILISSNDEPDEPDEPGHLPKKGTGQFQIRGS